MADPMGSRVASLAGATVVAVLAACAPTVPPLPSDALLDQSIETIHVVRFASGDARLSDAERSALTSFVASIDLAAPTALELRAAPPLAAVRHRSVSAVLRQLGAGPARTVEVAALGDRLVVAVETRDMVPAACLAAPRPGSGQLPPGCANAVNLARSVERPADLLIGRQPGPSLASPAARALTRYVTGQGPALLVEADASDGSLVTQ